ncbi:flippase [Pseudomonas aeruginosa]|uniref:flippase n=1 Tax=Pseudomonas aeruginosa TaxID=287 RepID=UPI001374D93B|nr:flippase [Pseudomonas aeruginosa]MBO0970912.1 flippase [Pseudomonas aeruginosa]MCV4098142.1 flippase [Pseudomonas aeruginosa]MDY1067903.1 flippase [Pseudomonas aeruginosa]MDY1179507.1 flippase [Pseudomonas aeruginosa]MDY1299737.1 flippase [Pseudomonas aeruginosa]
MSLLKNSFSNLIGSALPAVVALPALGYMARELETALFGAAMLIWALVGYASIFDAGLGKSVVRQIAISSAEPEKRGPILGSSLLFVLLSGGLAAALVHFFAEYLVVDIFKVDRSSYEDALTGTRVAALCIPFFLASLVLQGYLEGVEDFYSFNKYRALSGTLTYLLPVAFLLFEKTFSSLIYGLLFARVGSCFLIALIVSRRCSVWTWRWDVKVFKTLISFGSWLTITNIISPVMVYMDKFLIARITGAGELAYYAAPSELINRMSILPVAITRAVFPRLSALGGQGSASVKRQALLYSGGLVLPIIIVLFFVAPWGMGIWLGPEYSGTAAQVFQIMLVGYLFNSIALVPYNNLQAKGYSRTTAMVHLLEVLPYLMLMYFSVQQWGVVGAASIWSLRMAVDCILMAYLDSK